MPTKRVRKTRRGITMILAILIVSAVVAIGITVSTIVVTQVRINEVVSSTHEGYYAAESGLEQGLHRVQALKTSTTLANAIVELQALVLPVAAVGQPEVIASENRAFFASGDTKLASSADESSVAQTIAELQENQSVYVEMYDVDNSLTSLGTTPTLCVYAEGMDTDGAGTDDAVGNEVLEVSWVAWTTRLESSRSQRVVVSYSSFSNTTTCTLPESGGYGASIPLTQFYPAFLPSLGTDLAGFRIRITPLKPSGSGNGNVANFRAYLDPQPTSQIRLKSVSSGKNQKQALVATFPWTLPLSSLFDFVIFSERTLEKSIELSVAEDVKTYGPFEVEASIDPDLGPLAPTTPFEWYAFSCGNRRNYCTEDLDDCLNVKCARKGLASVHCQGNDGFSTAPYCDGDGAGGSNFWVNPDATTMSTRARDVRCWQDFDGSGYPIASHCGFNSYDTTSGSTHKLSLVVPDAPFADCTIGPCNYYVRVRGTFNRSFYVNYVENIGTTPTFYYDYDTRADGASVVLKSKEQLIKNFNTGTPSSCILPTPISVNPGVTTRFLIFRNPADTDPNAAGGTFPMTIDSYDILTQPSFVGPEESYCPTT